MHLYLYARGILQQVKLWEAITQNHFWQWKRTKLKTGKEEITLVQGALRPSVLGAYEYIFPEDCLPEVLAVLGITNKQRSFKLAVLRRVFGARAIPNKIYEEAKNIKPSIILNESKRGLHHSKINGVSVHVIGIKKDRFAKHSCGYYQEWL